jgi:hypothetical protein
MAKHTGWPGVVQCLECKAVLVSNYTHDYKTCGCPNQTMVDGGKDYLRYGGVSMSKVRVLRLSIANMENKK